MAPMSRPPRRRARSGSLSPSTAVFPQQSIPSNLPSSSVRCHVFCAPDSICLLERASFGSLRRTPRSFVSHPSRACPVSLSSVFRLSVTIRRCLRIPIALSTPPLPNHSRNAHNHYSRSIDPEIFTRKNKKNSPQSRNASFAIFPNIRDPRSNKTLTPSRR